MGCDIEESASLRSLNEMTINETVNTKGRNKEEKRKIKKTR
jgi:hypothetical protein